MTDEIKPDAKKRVVFNKDFWISLGVSFGVGALMSGLIFWIEISLSKYDLSYEFASWTYAEDALGASGLLLLLFFLLQWIATYGLFDILAYSVQVLFFTVFRPNYRKTGFPATFADYKELKNREERKPIIAILLISFIFIAAGIACMAVSLSLR